MPSEKTPRRLGRGLDALFNAAASAPERTESALRDIPLRQIRSNPFQPRKDFDPQELKELRESLDASGLLQPITVRPRPGTDDEYELIAGERRLRAAADLGWTSISSVVKNMDDRQLLALALIENLQRTNLNPIEEAEGYERLISEFGHTQLTVATMVGRDRSTVANMLRVLQLPATIRQMMREGLLTAGHARPLLGLADESRMITLAREIVQKGLSARDIEQRVRESAPDRKDGRGRGRPSRVDTRPVAVRDFEGRLRKYLQTDVSIALMQNHKGSLRIAFYSAEDLERLTDLIGLTRNPQ